MLNPLHYLLVYIAGTFWLWLLFVFWHYAKTGQIKWAKYPFTVARYYLLTIFLAAYPVYIAINRQNGWVLWLFVIFGLSGMLAETLMSMWWHIFFEKRFYYYTEEPLGHKYTSGLNFILWGGGGLLYINIIKILAAPAAPQAAQTIPLNLPFYYLFFSSMLLLISLQMLVWVSYVFHKRHNHKIQKVTFWNYLFFSFPFLFPVIICAFVYGPIFFTIALWFGVGAAFTEYLFGKIFQKLLTEKLWIYNHWAVDDGHFTPLAVPAFCFLGFYFWAIALIAQSFIK
jgi:hypothetical protein